MTERLVRIAARPGQVTLRFLALCLLSVSASAQTSGEQDATLEEVRVVGDASLASAFEQVGNYARVDEAAIALTGPVHPNETLVRVPGVWVSRGSGQEHLTAIRSAVLTGPGACGSFLLLENGVPVRPSGFCNVNGLFEVHTELASGIEVVRGPASALYGGNALRGVINVQSPGTPAGVSVTLEGGPWDYARAGVRAGMETERGQVGVAFTGVTANGWRDATGHDQQKLSLNWDTVVGAWDVSTLLSAVNLNQETGGFVVGFEAYKDGDLRDTNPNPEAFRDVQAVRLSSAWSRDLGDRRLVVTPYLRMSDMDFLQHFLPGQPLEQNGHDSAGLIARLHGRSGIVDWTVGLQTEFADTWLKENQEGPTVGSPSSSKRGRPARTTTTRSTVSWPRPSWTCGRRSRSALHLWAACGPSGSPTTTTIVSSTATRAMTARPAASVAASTRAPPIATIPSRISPDGSASSSFRVRARGPGSSAESASVRRR